mgnify:CR=1 FL=1
MVKKIVAVNLDLDQNEIQNFIIQNLANSPENLLPGQIWYNTSENLIYYYNGTTSLPVGYLRPATTEEAGVIRIATNTEATAGTETDICITPYQLKNAITTAQVGALVYRGTWNITNATDFSGITLPVKIGYMYKVVGEGPKTIGGIEWNAGDYIIMEGNVPVGGTIEYFSKLDNSESGDIVRLVATQTLQNKTISADDNTITDLQLTNFKEGVIQTTIRESAEALDTSLATEKAIRTALDNRAAAIFVDWGAE